MPAISGRPTWIRRLSRSWRGASTTFSSPTRSRPSIRRAIMADIAQRTMPPLPPTRAERVVTLDAMGAVGDVERPLGPIERITNITLVRRLIVLVILAMLWEAYAR